MTGTNLRVDASIAAAQAALDQLEPAGRAHSTAEDAAITAPGDEAIAAAEEASNQFFQAQSKEHMRARGVRSPDEWDAVVLTFAEPVRDRPAITEEPGIPAYATGPQGWMA